MTELVVVADEHFCLSQPLLPLFSSSFICSTAFCTATSSRYDAVPLSAPIFVSFSTNITILLHAVCYVAAGIFIVTTVFAVGATLSAFFNPLSFVAVTICAVVERSFLHRCLCILILNESEDTEVTS